MKAKLYVIMLLFIIAIPGLFAEECIIEYIEGNLEIQKGNKWVEAEEGDEIPVTAVLRTDDDTFVEISYNHNLYTLSAKGTYNIESILASSEDAGSWDIVDIVENKLAYIINDDVESMEASCGTRGDPYENLDEIIWVLHNDVVVWRGKYFINKGKYDKALAHLQNELNDCKPDDEEVTEYLFYIGYCYSLLGEKTLALVTLTKIEVDEDAEYFGTFILLKARLLAESLSFRKALSLIDRYLKKNPEGDNVQAANFLSAYCFEGLNQRGEAIKRLKRVVEIDSLSPIGKEAKKQLKKFEAE